MPTTFYEGQGKGEIKFRLKEKVVKKTIVVKSNDVILGKRFILAGVPGEMMTLQFDKNGATGKIQVEID